MVLKCINSLAFKKKKFKKKVKNKYCRGDIPGTHYFFRNLSL